jgi:hypothetical protein
MRFDTFERHSLLDGLDHFSGMFALLVTLMIGVDIFSWITRDRPPHGIVLWAPVITVNMWRRVVSGEDSPRPWPASWLFAMGVYDLLLLAVALVKGPATGSDWGIAGFAAFFAAAFLWKAARS